MNTIEREISEPRKIELPDLCLPLCNKRECDVFILRHTYHPFKFKSKETDNEEARPHHGAEDEPQPEQAALVAIHTVL